jgi:hypothetical protein
MYDSLRDEIERLHAEITITEQKLSTAGDEACKQRYSLLHGLLVTDQLLLKLKRLHNSSQRRRIQTAQPPYVRKI